eukprot:1157619-Pelagomonas_calceolata.AAC.29
MVYSKVMDRYPNNGKVLKCFGKFLEEVKNDIAGATKYYSEGNRLGTTDAIMNIRHLPRVLRSSESRGAEVGKHTILKSFREMDAK